MTYLDILEFAMGFDCREPDMEGRAEQGRQRWGRGDGSVVSSSALFQRRGLNLAIVSSRSVILTPTIVYISARVFY